MEAKLALRPVKIEKVFTDCVGCPLFRTCGQHAVVLALDERQVRQTTMRLRGGAEERVA